MDAFMAYLKKYEQAIHFALHSGFEIGHPGGDLHTSRIAKLVFLGEPPQGGSPAVFKCLSAHVQPHALFVAQELDSVHPDDPARIVSFMLSGSP